jgi:hypothetical protein
MYRRIGRLIQIGVFAALPAGAAFAQGAGNNVANTGGVTDKVGGQGAQRANGLAGTTPTDDTRTPAQEKAGKLDETAPALPGDSTRPGEITPKTTTDTDIHESVHSTDTGTTGTTGTQDNTGRMGDTTGSTTPGSGSTDSDMKKSDNDLGSQESTTTQKKSIKHKRTHKSSSSSSSVESKSNLNMPDDSSMNKKLDDKTNLDTTRDQLDSDK